MKEWETVTIGKCCKVIAGQSPESSFYNKEKRGLPFYQGKKDFGDMFISPPTVWTEQVTKTAEADDILMSVRAPVGPVNIASSSICIGRGLAAIRPTNLIHRNYLYYFFKCIEPTLTGTAGAVFPSINKAQIEAIKIPLPPLPAQKAIVAKLDAAFASIDTAIAAAVRNAENAEKLYKLEVDSVFNSFDCEVKALGENAEISYGYTAKSSSQIKGPHYLRITDIQNNDVNWNDVPRCVVGEKEFKKFQLTTGDIVFARTGATTGKSFLLAAPPPAVFASYLIKVVVNKSVFRPDFIYQYFQSASYWNFVNAGISGAAQGGFNASKLSSLPIPLPPLDEQDNAVQRLLDFQSQTKQLAEIYSLKAETMSALKQSLLQQAFSGQLVDA